MPEENDCISVEFEDGSSWDYCWDDLTPYSNWSSDNVTTGLRSSQGPTARAWRTCQYYLKGMPAVCSWWVEGATSDEGDTVTSGSFFCSYKKSNTSDNPQDPPSEIPSGFNGSKCDFLGRRHWCSKYEESGPADTNRWICTAPNPYLTGLGEKSSSEEAAIFTPIPRDRIWGYNITDDGTGTGMCDCYGMGRGSAGCPIQGTDKQREAKLSELPIVCNFYRPFQMGFGIIDPQMKRRGDVDDDKVTITEQGWKAAQRWDEDPEYRLPLNYKLYNLRAQFQKCQWWYEDSGRSYEVDESGFLYLEGAPDIFDSTGKVEFCKCTNTDAIYYNTRIFETTSGTGTGSQMALDGVWALGGGPVCNGARPECPCYSGKWTFLEREKMLPGMPVTANQILELRFWSQDWDSQEDYNDYYAQASNFDDPPSPAIYTFTKWDRKAVDTMTMFGKRLSLCQPAPLHQKEFTLDYIEVEDPIKYYNVQIGTSTENDQRHFPTLIRNPYFPDLKPLVVTYPYYNDNVFDVEACMGQGPAGHIKRHNNIYGDSVKTVGQTIRNKKVYTINTNYITVDEMLLNFSGVYAVRDKNIYSLTAESIKNQIYSILRGVVSTGLSEQPNYIKYTVSDDIFGYFLIPDVKLKYNTANLLLVCVDYGDGTWEYRWRGVINRWYGGIIKQIEFNHEYQAADDGSGWTNSQPESITPSADATAKAQNLGFVGKEPPEIDIYSTFSIDDVVSGHRYYSYSIQEITVEDSLELYWGSVGNTNKIWLELSDININYVYNWDIEYAELRVITELNEDGTETPVRSGDFPDIIPLSKMLVDDNSIPPNACLLQPQDSNVRLRFLSSEWELYVTYKYEKLTNNEVHDAVVWGAGKSDIDKYRSPYDINYDNDSGVISVESISDGSVQLMAHFLDEHNRIISTFATKLLVHIVRESCRSVDIFYRYEAEGRQYKLMPESGFCIDIKQDMAITDPYKHVEIPNCGDHEYSQLVWQGPMWFPFNACRGYDMYDEFTVCNSCQAGYVGPMNGGVNRDEEGNIIYAGGQVVTRNDYRYCGPYKYDAFGVVRGNWAASCDCGCRFSYSDASAATVVFTGYGRKMTTVDLAAYAEFEWTPPPFGNEGRELVEKFISQDFVNHLLPRKPYQRNEWMPMVLDQSVFFSTFNAYDYNPEDEYMGISEYYSLEPFRYTNQLNMGVLTTINENFVEEEDGGVPTGKIKRFRWDELFNVHHEGNCSYPFPAYPISNNYTKAVFYYLKNDWHAWSWQEDWKDIERNLDGNSPETPPDPENPNKNIDVGRLDFLDLIRPLYIFDAYKAEHRRIIDEGTHVIYYEAPVMDDEGNMTKYPSLSILGGKARPFEILYDEDSYTSSNPVIWQNEGGSFNTQGSSDNDNIYEQANNPGASGDWVHDPNTLFDSAAVSGTEEASAAGRRVTVSIDDITYEPIYKYFNRGLIANITRDRLYYLPKKETSLIYSSSSDGVTGIFEATDDDIDIDTLSTREYEHKNIQLIPGVFVWDDSLVTITSQTNSTWSFFKLRVSGNWGSSEGLTEDSKPTVHEMLIPGISMTCNFEDDTVGSPRSQTTSSTELILPEKGQRQETYDIYLDFLLGPVEMLTKRTVKFNINLSGFNHYFISINEIELVKADYIDIRYEYINVWERKYVASKMNDVTGNNINLDGPGDHLHYQNDLNNSGQYFNFRETRFLDREVSAVDKTKTVSCGIHYSDNESIGDITYDNLHEIELNSQRELYEYAYDIDPSSDSIIYSPVTPYKYKEFLDGLGIFPITPPLAMVSDKLLWEKHKKFKQFKQYDYWRPGGHFYTWDSNFRREKCTIFGQPEDVFSGYYAHVDHVGIGNPLEIDSSKPIDPGNSYYSLRFYTQQAKYDRTMILSGGDPEYTDKWRSSTSYNGRGFINP